MTYLEILDLLMNTARRSPNINTVVREFTDLNREGIEYSAIVIQDRDGYRDYINNQDYITYTWYIGYVDMLTEEAVNNNSYPVPKTIDNRDDIVSTGINVINDIINTINSSYYPHLELTVSDRINTFHQRFTAECAGVYLVLNANVPLSDCSESEVKLFGKISETITENGVYHYVPSGDEIAYDGVDITVNVSGGGEKPEERLVETIVSNGEYSFSPSAGSVFSDASIAVDVHPSTQLIETITGNGRYSFPGEYVDPLITVNVSGGTKPEESLFREIRNNGSYSYVPEDEKVFNYVGIVVDVHPSTSLSETYISNGSYNISGEFSGGVVTVAVPTTVTVTMTQAQYDALQVEDPNTIYLING